MARRGKKINKKLAERQDRWDKMPSQGVSGGAKMINGFAYHRPGSQNLRQRS